MNFIVQKKYIILTVVISLVILTGAIAKGAQISSFWDKVAQYTGQIIGSNIVGKLEEELSFGALPGPDIYSDVTIHGTFTYGKEALATSTTATAYTMVEKDLQPYSMIDLMLNIGTTTFTLPATSTMIRLLPDLGSTREWVFHNATSSAFTPLTLAAGAGMDLVAVTVNDDVIDPGEWTRLNCTRIYYRSADNQNIMCIVDELTDAD